MKKLDGFRDVFKNTKRRKPAQLFCPRCASSKIQLSSSLDVWLTPKQYYCPECNYHGIIVMELEPDETQKDKEPQETESSPEDQTNHEKTNSSKKA
ncbi:MAG TPA: hypothetical protein VLH35_05110 [Candidatus Acidoferrales bacterium]|nr:hypothetical protein [Candidatus Acidoferrales bacterium]